MKLPPNLILRPEFAELGNPQQPATPPRIEDQTNTGTTPDGGDPAQGPQGQTSPCIQQDMLLIMIGMFAFIYFFMIRPQKKQEKQRKAMLATVSKGAKIVTSGGVHGTITNLSEQTVTIRVDTIKMVIDRQAISRVEQDDGGQKNGGS